MPIFAAFRNAFKIEELRKRILFTLGILVVFRVGTHIPMPGVNPGAVEAFRQQMETQAGGLFGLMQVFSGGAIGNLALFTLGIMPYITASIIMQLMTKVSPTLEELSKEGPAGQRKIAQYTRYLTIPICLVQGFFASQQLMRLQAQQEGTGAAPILLHTGFGQVMLMVLSLMAGALFIMWIGEKISEHGLGNGASVLIMAGIIAQIPHIGVRLVTLAGGDPAVSQGVTWPKVFTIAGLYVLVVVGIVFVTQAQRRIPIQHAKHFRGRRVWMGSRNYMPIKVNTAGVMPVIFASSLLIIPQLLGFIPGLSGIRDVINRGGFVYATFYIVMIFFFSYFWTYLFFQPSEMANNLKEYGSFIPGIRPGEVTAKYLDTILARITLFGAAFLAMIALMPDMMGVALGMDTFMVSFLGGTGILIVVGVCLDMVQKTESYLIMHHYQGFLGTGAIKGRR